MCKKKLTVGEMFSGPGGIGLALNLAKHSEYSFKHEWATDYDKDTSETYKHNVLKNCTNPNDHFILKDIRELDIDSLPSVDGFLYGFPCNDFSLVGEQKGFKGKFGPLYSYGIKYINRVNPLFFLAENVSGLKSANSGKALKRIMHDLNHAGKYGYTLTVNLYKFEEYGIPQTRHRYIIIGMRGDLGLTYQVPTPSYKIMTCKEALSSIDPNAKNQEKVRQSDRVIKRLSYIAEGETTSSVVNFERTINGYRIIKFICSADKDQGSKSETDFPFIRYAEVLLNYAEAKAELGELTDNDIKNTIDLIRTRAGVQTLGAVPTTPDALMQQYYPNASGAQVAAILEIRRERTVELFAEGQRLYDLLRWKEGKWITPSSTSGFQGIYIDALGEQDLDGDGKADAFFYKGASKPAGISKEIPAGNIVRIGTAITLSGNTSGYLVYFGTETYSWNEDKDYLWPIPLSQIQATGGALTQNPGYDDIDR